MIDLTVTNAWPISLVQPHGNMSQIEFVRYTRFLSLLIAVVELINWNSIQLVGCSLVNLFQYPIMMSLEVIFLISQGLKSDD